MKTDHLVALAIGIALGFFILPMILNAVGGSRTS